MNHAPDSDGLHRAVDVALSALQSLASAADKALSAALLVEAHIAIAAITEAADFDGVLSQ